MNRFKNFGFIFFLAFQLHMFSSCSTDVVELYISPTGSDYDVGTREAPFATLERARDEIRELKKQGLKSDVSAPL